MPRLVVVLAQHVGARDSFPLSSRFATSAASRDTGGVPNPDHPDQHTATGTTPNEEFVGRVAGQDVGYAGETGAEARAAADAEED